MHLCQPGAAAAAASQKLATDDGMKPEERVALEEAALKWMADNNAGIKKALQQPKFSVFTQGQLQRAQGRAAARARTGNLCGNAQV
jgi:hypothetical protein